MAGTVALLCCAAVARGYTLDPGSKLVTTDGSRNDVQNAIGDASVTTGWTVLLPPGTNTWSSSCVIAGKAIHLEGAGKSSTTILGAVGSGGTVSITKSANGYVEVSGIRFQANGTSTEPSTTYHIKVEGGTSLYPVLIHDCDFFSTYNVYNNWAINLANNGGIIWSNRFFTTGYFINGVRVKGAEGSDNWMLSSTMGTGDTTGWKNTYIEDCIFDMGRDACVDADDLSRVVVRYCTFTNGVISPHGNEHSEDGVRHLEIYKNRFVWDEARINWWDLNHWLFIRGATGLICSNTFDAITSRNAMDFTIQCIRRDCYHGCITSYPGLRQIGQSANGTSYITEPYAVWGNTGDATANAPGLSQYEPDECGNGQVIATYIQVNRDYYTNRTGWATNWTPYTYPHPLRTDQSTTAPSIMSHPSSQVRTQGQSATFTVYAKGSSPLSYQWQKASANISGATGASYTIASVVTNDAGSYRCIVTNAYGMATSAVATLEVYLPIPVPANITGNPQNLSRAVGQSATFTVTAAGDAPLAYQWQKNSATISGATASSYTIASVVTNDAGSYRCIVTNALGSATSVVAILTINVPARIVTNSQSLGRTVGESATFSVTAAGDAPLAYQWRKNVNNILGATASSYTIASVATNDAGSYRCIVSNVFGTATGAVLTLTVSGPVQVPASITSDPQGLSRTVGQIATFSVTAAGDAPLAYQWQKNSASISGATVSSYTIIGVVTNNAGSYRCIVTNAFGAATSAVATLTVSGGASGTVRYVDFATGSDSNPGTATSPWKRCPGMVGWSGSATLQPGDTVYFDRGRTWDIEASSGISPGLDLKAGVHYIGNQWDPQGVGLRRAVLRAVGKHEAGNVRFWEDHATIPTEIEGFEIDGNGYRANGIDINHAFWTTGLTDAVKRVRNCVVHGQTGNGSEGDYKYGIIVSDNSPDASGWVANVEILDTIVHNVPRAGILLYPSISGMISNIVVRGCETFSTCADPSHTRCHGIVAKYNVKNSIVEYCYVHDVNAAAMYIGGAESGDGPGPTGLSVRYNILQTTAEDGVIRFYGSGNKSVDVYGNIVLENEVGGGLSFSGNYGTIAARIYNNTFFDSFVDIGDPTSTGTIEFRNNLIYELDDVALTDSGSDITAHSNNIYCRTNGGTRVRIGGVNYTASSITNWEPTAMTADPRFRNSSVLPNGFDFFGNGINPNSFGLSVQQGSVALDNGATLGNAFNGSINSVMRPYGMAWDVGAYENVIVDGSLTPPTITNVTQKAEQ